MCECNCRRDTPSWEFGTSAVLVADLEVFRLHNVRLYELFYAERARVSLPQRASVRAFLGDPQHRLASFGFAKTEVRLARDGNGYSFCEYQEFHGKWATWCWEKSPILNPGKFYNRLREQEQYACHRALLRILRKENDFLKGRKVLTNPTIAHVLPEHVVQLIATFVAIDKATVEAMTYVKRTLFLKNKPWRRV